MKIDGTALNQRVELQTNGQVEKALDEMTCVRQDNKVLAALCQSKPISLCQLI